jgi:hypothetical protein
VSVAGGTHVCFSICVGQDVSRGASKQRYDFVIGRCSRSQWSAMLLLSTCRPVCTHSLSQPPCAGHRALHARTDRDHTRHDLGGPGLYLCLVLYLYLFLSPSLCLCPCPSPCLYRGLRPCPCPCPCPCPVSAAHCRRGPPRPSCAAPPAAAAAGISTPCLCAGRHARAGRRRSRG